MYRNNLVRITCYEKFYGLANEVMIDLKSTIALQRRVMRCRFSFINFFLFVFDGYI
jgi:hypothetical protein